VPTGLVCRQILVGQRRRRIWVSKKWKLEVAKPAIVNTFPKGKKIDKLLGWESEEH
jgi:hypothetical protein